MINFGMWKQALTVIPRISREEWDGLDIVSRWLVATRSAVFVMTAISCAVGGMLAWRDGRFIALNFVLCLAGLVFAHATNNLVNDLVDFRMGIDRDNYYRTQYGPQTVQSGFLSQKQILGYIAVTGAVAAACGAALVALTGTATLVLMAAGAVFVLFYTWPLKYIGLGEPTVLLVWGPLMVGGSYFVTSGGAWDWNVALVALVYAAGPTTVLFGKHIDKRLQDREKKVYTLPVILGEKAARFTTIGLWAAQYLLVVVLVFIGALGPAMAIVTLAVGKFAWVSKVFARPRPESEPPDLPPNVWPLYLSAHAFVYNRTFGALFLSGLVADAVLTAHRFF